MTTPALVTDPFVAPVDDAVPLAAGALVRLLASSCPACSRTDVPPRDRCGACGQATNQLALPTVGTLRLATSVLHPPPDALVEAPYHVGVATFAGRRDVMGLLTEDASDHLGIEVETVALEFAPGRLTYAFRPRSGGPDVLGPPGGR